MGAVEQTIAGLAGVWDYHYDVCGDVLYVALASKVGEPALGEEVEEGFILRRSIESDTIVGMTVVRFWQRYGVATGDALTPIAIESALSRFLDGVPASLTDEARLAAIHASHTGEIDLAAIQAYESALPKAANG